jgi:hypothetical protein
MKREYVKVLGLGYFILGIFLLLNAKIGITGAVIGTSTISSAISLILGLVFMIVGMVVLAGGKESEIERIVLTSSVKENKPLLRITKDAVNNMDVQRELDHLIEELGKGNFEAGLGEIGHVRDTDVFYLRGDNGARLYYRKIGKNNYDIVCKSCKGYNQDRALNALGKIYQRKKN